MHSRSHISKSTLPRPIVHASGPKWIHPKGYILFLSLQSGEAMNHLVETVAIQSTPEGSMVEVVMDDLRIMTSLHLGQNGGIDTIVMMGVANMTEVKDAVMITMAMLDDNMMCITVAQDGVGRAALCQVVRPDMHSVEVLGTILRFCMAGKKDTSLQVRVYTM